MSQELTNCLSLLSTHVTEILNLVWSGLNSNFSTALLGSLAGAYAGAVAAQKIAERSKQREELLKELRNVNAAIMVAFSACNTALRLKKQHIQPIFEKFEQDKKALQEFKSNPSQDKAPFELMVDLRVFEAPLIPTETLKDLVFNRISAYGRPLSLVSILEESALGIRAAIMKRAKMVERFQDGSISKAAMPNFYFGLPLPSGDTNQEYPDLVEAIHSYIEDIAFFSSLLSSDLVDHGKQIHKMFTEKFGKGAPNVSAADFSRPKELGLIPPDSQYQDWLNGFSIRSAEGEAT